MVNNLEYEEEEHGVDFGPYSDGVCTISKVRRYKYIPFQVVELYDLRTNSMNEKFLAVNDNIEGERIYVRR